MLPKIYLLAALLAIVSNAGAVACTPEEPDCVEVGSWDIGVNIGLGGRTNPLAGGRDIPLLLTPEINYNGEHFFIQNTDVGYILFDAHEQQLSLLVRPSYDQGFFKRWDTGNALTQGLANPVAGDGLVSNTPSHPVVGGGLVGTARPNAGDSSGADTPPSSGNGAVNPPSTQPNASAALPPHSRDTAGLAGFEYSVDSAWADLQFQYVHDISGVHQGDEARVSATHQWTSGKHHLNTTLGAIWQSQKVVDYYYGVTPLEADARGPYEGSAAVSTVLRVDWRYTLTEHWELRMLGSYRGLPPAITASPLVSDKQVITGFVGGVYHF